MSPMVGTSPGPELLARVRAGEIGGVILFGSNIRGVAATAKHFPGLGTASATTDAHRVTIRASRADLLRRLEPFRAAIARGVDLVMVSNAVYSRLDPSGLPAVLSPRIVGGLLRGTLGFHGVVIA